MRISPSHPGSALDVDGLPLITSTGVEILSAAVVPFARGRMGSGEDVYGQYPQSGQLPSGAASWAELGDFPEHAMLLLTSKELTVAEIVGDDQLRTWGRWEIPSTPSQELGGAEKSVLLPWVSTAAVPHSKGLVVPPSDLQARVYARSGAVWVVSAGGVSVIDFGADAASLYQADGGRRYTGSLLPDKVPDDPFGDPDPDAALAAGPYRAAALQDTRTHSWACVVGEGGATLLRKNLEVGGVPFSVVERHLFDGMYPYDAVALPDGRTVAVGLSGAEVGDFVWAIRASVSSGVTGPSAWSTVQRGPRGFPQFTPKLAFDGERLWACSGEGHIWRFSDTVDRMTENTNVEYWAGPPASASPAAEPRFRSLHRASAIAGITFDAGVMHALLLLTPTQGGGSLLCSFNEDVSRILWRRLYRGTMVGITSSPLLYPASVPVVLGESPDPAVGYGPDEVLE